MCVCVCVCTVGFHKLKPALLFFILMAAFQLPGIYGQGETDSCILASPIIYGEYYDNPGTYHLRLYVNFVRKPDNLWINQQQADAAAAAALEYINDVYNQYGIYFVNPSNPCSAPTANLITTTADGVETIRDVVPGAKHEDGIDLYVFGGTGSAAGYAFGIPNTYFSVEGQDNGAPAAETPVSIHELGHCLGLMHTHEDSCDDTSACPGGIDDCYCTGDYICDTPPTVSNLDCDTSALGTNYMSYSNLNTCRDNFTPEQALRMRAHLAGHDSLKNALIAPVVMPGGSLLGGPSGNIVVDSGEFHVTSTLEMLPGAYIWVKPGAKLLVSAKITGACGQMWRGVIVQGNNLAAQTPANQGRVAVNSSGIIEHAVCGIEARLVGGGGAPYPGSGGGIVYVGGGKFFNNITSIRFGSYPAPNASLILSGGFYTDGGYRARDISPTHLELINVSRLWINACEFKDGRMDCEAPSKRAAGISSIDAGFRAGGLCRFENLRFGIFANNLTENSGSFTAHNNRFKACNIGIRTRSISDFSITGNDFYVRAPDGCNVGEAVGVYLQGATGGFSLQGNFFHYDEATPPGYGLAGTNSTSLGQGMNNQIKGNIYENMTVANRAQGRNTAFEDGLVYLCDSVSITFSSIPGVIGDFLVEEEGSIWRDQEDVSGAGQRLPAGNVFSGSGAGSYSFQNLGPTINYLYYDGSSRQDPESTDLDPVGLTLSSTSNENTNCTAGSEPCTPPCSEEQLEELKGAFHEKKARWQERKAAYPLIEDEEEQAAALDSIIQLRRAMNRDARLILMSYSLDTAAVKADSILAWLALAETYPAGYRLARHYFFTGKFGLFDSLWAAIPQRYELGEAQLAELEDIEAVFNTVRHELEAGTSLSGMPEEILDILMYWQDDCTEPGALAQAILWRNGRRVFPDCNGEASRPGGFPVSAAEAEKAGPSPVKLYPNPSRGNLTLELPAGYGPAIGVFYNLQGRPVLKQSFPEGRHTIRLPHEQFRPGVYLVEIIPSSGRRERFKLILTH